MVTPETYHALGLSDQEYFHICEILGREPTPTELAMFSVEWSEHCGYMCSKSLITSFPRKNGIFPTAVGEDSGAVIVEDLAIVFKMESHNHPSQIEPFQGSATCVGGIIRDIFTAGARPIASLDSLRFGQLDNPENIHLFREVVKGIGWYGNCVGVPTIGGEVYFDQIYEGNCLVNGMTIGVCQKDDLLRAKANGIGNHLVYVGHSTGRDGIGGCSVLASNEFKEGEEKRPTVQVGDPFKEKCLIEATLEAMKEISIVGIKDMGAAGLTCSISEMAEAGDVGVNIDLDKVPVREEQMESWEIMMSESQERMLVCVKPSDVPQLKEIFKKWELNAEVIGEVTDTKRIQIVSKGEMVADIPARPLVDPEPQFPSVSIPPNIKDIDWEKIPDTNNSWRLEKIICSPSFASKHWIYEQYDHMVQTNTVVLPGGDASVIRLKDAPPMALAATTDCNAVYSYLNPYKGAKLAVVEALRNILCVGARPIGITDCLNFGNPNDPEKYFQFVQSVGGIRDVCEELNIPVVSGNVSFYNGNIYPTPTIGMIGIINDVDQIVTPHFKKENDAIILIGDPWSSTEEYGEYVRDYGIHGITPCPCIDDHEALMLVMKELTEQKIIHSAHDCAEGGLGVALAECLISYPLFPLLGAKILLDENYGERVDTAIFGETQGRIIVSCDMSMVASVFKICDMYDANCNLIGYTNASTNCGHSWLSIYYNDTLRVFVRMDDLKLKWEKRLGDIMK